MSRLSFIFFSLLMMLIAAPTALAAPLVEGGREPIPWLWWLGPIGSIVAFVWVFIFYKSAMKISEGTELMAEIAQAVRDGAMAYLRRQYKVVTLAFVVLFLLFVILA
jgi:K(+)-stimulated pyrophosphate-energized sodium pump